MELEFAKVVYAVLVVIVLTAIFTRRKKAVWPPLPLVSHLFYFRKNNLEQLRHLHDMYGQFRTIYPKFKLDFYGLPAHGRGRKSHL